VARRNALTAAVPFPIERSLRQLGARLKSARLRRNLSHESVAAKIGTNRRVIADAESGKPSTGIVVYAALLWAYGLLSHLDEVAAAERDLEGLTLASLRDRSRARQRRELDDDF
jgi:transcriptional regulator with XRE-family HTH domain